MNADLSLALETGMFCIFSTNMIHVDAEIQSCRRNIGVPKHLLNGPQIAPILMQVGCKRGPQQMGVASRPL